MLAELSAMQSVPFEAEEPNGSYYEYDRNLKATVKVTPDGERTPVEKLETSFEPMRAERLRAKLHTRKSQPEPAKTSIVHNRRTGRRR